MRKAAARILVVEDETLLSWIIDETLRDRDYDVTLATTGAAGLAAIEGQQHFDLLVTNINLADGPNGWSLARRAREVDPQIPVIFVSGDSAYQHADNGVPGSRMLSKPFLAEDLEKAVDEMLDNPLRPSDRG